MESRGTPPTSDLAHQGDEVVATLIRLADTLVEDFDLIEVLGGLARDCVRLLGASAAGILLATPIGELRVVAASSEASRLLELTQLQRDQGPCVDCFRSGAPVTTVDLRTDGDRWPLFTEAALDAGYRSVHALPMRLRLQVIGALNLFSAQPGNLSAAALRLGQALADMATISILQDRAIRESEDLAAHLQTALTSRVFIEQAKGVVAERGAISMDDAFVAIRRFARDRNFKVHDVSRGIADGTIDPTVVLAARRPYPRPTTARPPADGR